MVWFAGVVVMAATMDMDSLIYHIKRMICRLAAGIANFLPITEVSGWPFRRIFSPLTLSISPS